MLKMWNHHGLALSSNFCSVSFSLYWPLTYLAHSRLILFVSFAKSRRRRRCTSSRCWCRRATRGPRTPPCTARRRSARARRRRRSLTTRSGTRSTTTTSGSTRTSSRSWKTPSFNSCCRAGISPLQSFLRFDASVQLVSPRGFNFIRVPSFILLCWKTSFSTFANFDFLGLLPYFSFPFDPSHLICLIWSVSIDQAVVNADLNKNVSFFTCFKFWLGRVLEFWLVPRFCWSSSIFRLKTEEVKLC